MYLLSPHCWWFLPRFGWKPQAVPGPPRTTSRLLVTSAPAAWAAALPAGGEGHWPPRDASCSLPPGRSQSPPPQRSGSWPDHPPLRTLLYFCCIFFLGLLTPIYFLSFFPLRAHIFLQQALRYLSNEWTHSRGLTYSISCMTCEGTIFSFFY